MEIKDILINARLKAGKSQQQVANAIGVSQKAYSMYESGERNPKSDKIIKLKALFGSELFSTNSEVVIEEPTPKYQNKGQGGDFYQDLYIAELKDKVRLLEEHNGFLSRNFEVSLNSIAQSQHAQLAYQKALVWYQAHIVTKGDEKKTLAELGIVSNKVAEYAGITYEKNKQEGKKSSS